MPSAAAVTFRPIYMEDLAVTIQPTGDTAVENVLDQGATTLTKIPIQLLAQIRSAASDAAAAAAGVPVGQIYFSTTFNALQARLI